jgi:hypothetical protein
MTSSSIPDSISIHVASGGAPLRGAWVSVSFGMQHKNPHGVLAGPSDESGEVRVVRETVERNVQRAIETSPMDYVGLDAWDGSIRVQAMGRELVGKIFSAVDVWDDLGSLESEDNLQQLKEYDRQLEQIPGQRITVRATSNPRGSARIATIDAIA